MSADVLVLNRHFQAVEVASWQRALGLLYLDHAHVVDEEYRTYNFKDWLDLSKTITENPGGFVHTPTMRIAIPEVLTLHLYDKLPRREVPFTRRNIYQHYNYHCCYCGRCLPSEKLNLDHVIPRSRGGPTDWSNIVTSCIPCNLRKGNRLPQEAGMHLKVRPTKPKGRHGAAIFLRSPVPIRRSWQRFIDSMYWNSELED